MIQAGRSGGRFWDGGAEARGRGTSRLAKVPNGDPFLHLVNLVGHGSGGLGLARVGSDRRQVAETPHVQVSLGAPALAGDVAQPGTDEQERGVAVGKGANHPGATADLAHDAFERVVGAQRSPVFTGESEVAESLLDVRLDQRGRRRQLHLVEFGDDLQNLDPGGGPVFDGMDRLEHGGDRANLGGGHQRPDVAIEMCQRADNFDPLTSA